MEKAQSKSLMAGRRAVVIAGLLLGLGLWVLSPVLVGQVEPWDAERPYYTVVLLAGGVLLGLAWPQHWLSAFFALWGGQCIALLFPPHELAWYLVGVATTGIGSLLGLVGVMFGATVKFAWRAIARRNSADVQGNFEK